jgi:NADPH-dependent 2,4-dienoyl-CoA reductase/sulfur reductase-like enzyme
MESVRYLLLGGGPTCAAAADAIRKRDEEGSILIVSADREPPYDRPPLSKKYVVRDDFVPEDIHAKDESFYSEKSIDLKLRSRAISLDRENRKVRLESGEEIGYERLLLATGATPEHLEVTGEDLPNVFKLRTIADAERIRAAAKETKSAILVGAGYIGMEVASSFCAAGIEPTVVDPHDRVWSKFASREVADYLQGQFEKQGVHFALEEEVVGIRRGDKGLVVETGSGRRLEAEMVVVGIGVYLNTNLAHQAGLEVDEAEGVKVDKNLQTQDPHIWAAGDIACFEDVAMGKRWHVEHHLNAKWQGAAAGANMAGAGEPYDKVPYFFSDMFDLHMILRGDPQADGERRIVGDLEGGEFVEVTGDKDGRLRLGIAFSFDEPKLDLISDRLEELIRKGAKIEEFSQ